MSPGLRGRNISHSSLSSFNLSLGWLVAAEYIALRTLTELKVSNLTVMGLGSYDDDNYDTLLHTILHIHSMYVQNSKIV